MLICTKFVIYPKRTHYTVDLEELKGICRVTLIFMSLYTWGHFTAPLHCFHYTIIFCFRNVAIWINSYSTIYCTSDGSLTGQLRSTLVIPQNAWLHSEIYFKSKVGKTYTVKNYMSPNEIVLTLLTCIKTKLERMGCRGMFFAWNMGVLIGSCKY